MKTIDLRSDTVTTPSAAMRQAIAEAEVGDDVFEGDPTVKKLENRVAEILGHEAALYVPSGTMANQVSLRTLTSPGDEILCERGTHIVNYEVAAASALSGIQLTPIDAPDGILTPELIEPFIRPENIHHPNTALIAIENTHNRAGGRVYPMELLDRIEELARRHNLKYYLDGARIWNAAAYHGIPPSEIAKHFDVVSVCFSKGLGAPVGSAVISSKDNIKKARRIRKMLGGGMRQVGIIAAGALFALENNLERIPEDHRRARMLAILLAQSGIFKIDPDEVQTNIVVIDLPLQIKLDTFIDKLKSNGLLVVPFGASRIRAVAHLNVDDDGINRAAEILMETARMEI
ncbi:MAG: DegT/DnrJ/EryC1/StrS family aminotransferase [Candidatus Zixiibacteriota bacterium]|nr:MAG: DegT/DnrJ/EryC1/StrS family aminotransferase [candidate division Zixibacteria bacterium]